MKKVKLEEIFEIARGGSPRPIKKFVTKDPNGVNWIKIGDTTESKYITKTKEKIIEEGISKSRYVEPGDFLLTNSMSFGRPYILKIDGCIHDGWLVLKPKSDQIFEDYIYYILGSPAMKREFKKKAKGTTVKNLNISLVSDVEIPLPSLSEQKAIVAKLDRAKRLIDIDKDMLAKYDELIQSVFLEMFGDPVTNPKGWELEKGRTLFNFKSGKYIKKDFLDDNFEFPVYGGNGVRGYYDDFLVDYPTLIIGRVGAKCGVIHSIKNKSWITDNAIFLEDFAYPDKINFYFTLLKLLNINQYADYSGQPKITQKPLKNLDVIIPSEDLILYFEKVYSQIIDEKKKLESSLTKSEELFSSLVQGAFG